MKTVIHSYYFNTEKADEREAYSALVAARTAEGLSCFSCVAMDYYSFEGPTRESARKHRENVETYSGKEITLETAHLFNSQWNSTECGRVFDWYEGVYPNRHIHWGHWLEQTEEMRVARWGTLKCGYCGKQAHISAGLEFCPHCLDSEYLKVEDLYLLRLRPCGEGFGTRRAPLTDEERALLLPRYHEAQGIGKTQRDQGRMSAARARIIKERDEVPTKALQAVEDENVKAAGLLWLLDRGFDESNAIYYTHTRRFGLGWRVPLASVPDYMTEFPFDYDCKLVPRSV